MLILRHCQQASDDLITCERVSLPTVLLHHPSVDPFCFLGLSLSWDSKRLLGSIPHTQIFYVLYYTIVCTPFFLFKKQLAYRHGRRVVWFLVLLLMFTVGVFLIILSGYNLLERDHDLNDHL